MITEPSNKSRHLIPLTKWPENHSYPPLGQLRALVFNANKNGFHKVIRRCGRRVLLDQDEYFIWLDSQNNKTA